MPTLTFEYWGLKKGQLKRITDSFTSHEYRTEKLGDNKYRFECKVPHDGFDIHSQLSQAIGDYTCRITDPMVE